MSRLREHRVVHVISYALRRRPRLELAKGGSFSLTGEDGVKRWGKTRMVRSPFATYGF